MSSIEWLFVIIGFSLSAISVLANDVIQTLGTFLSSNTKRKWYVLWLFIGGIFAAVMLYAWFVNDGDVAFGRLEKIPFPDYFHWWYILPPIILLIITRFGVPVSTTFLILSLFSSSLISKMLLKSVLGYFVAFGSAIVLYLLIAKVVEKRFLATKNKAIAPYWYVLQWSSTAFLWSQWLVQDVANIFVYLPRPLDPMTFYISLVGMLLVLAYILYIKGGNIQKIVTSKTNTDDIRSATIVDFLYGVILLVFKELSAIPMSTTWIFIGLLAGRELAITIRVTKGSLRDVSMTVFRDLFKACIGILVSVALVWLIGYLRSI